MPIIGLTDRGLSFPEIGQIRKGIKETRTRQDGSSYTVPKDLEFFRVEFDQRESRAAARFVQVYGEQPQEINVILPFDEIERCWDAWLEAYTAGRLVARSDGQKFVYLVNTETGEAVVKNGVPIVPYIDGQVVGKDYEGKDVFARPVGRLRVIVPELARAAYLTVHTTSVNDIANISMQLEAFKQINDGVIKGIPLVLRRRPKKISIPTKDGQRARMQKWLLSIEADPEWVRAKLAEVKTLALPNGQTYLLPDLAADSVDAVAALMPEIYGDRIQDDVILDENVQDGQTEPEPEDPQIEFTRQATMSYEMAKTVRTREGDLYDEMETDKLFEYWGQIQGLINKGQLDEDKLDEGQYKLAAIASILSYRERTQ